MMPRRFPIWTVSLCLISIATAGCAGLTGGNGSVQPAVTIAPATAAVRAGSAQAFSASVTGLSSSLVMWAVNGISGGDSTVGTIDATGNYTAPATLPTPNTVAVQATSSANPSIHGTSTVTLENPVPVVSSISPTTIGLGPFTLVVTGSKFVKGAQVMFGSTALTTQFLSSTELAATGTAVASQAGNVTVTVQNPDPGLITSTTSKIALVKNGGQVQTAAAAVRFLEQSTFGPTPAFVNQLQQLDFSAFLNDQFAAPMSTYADPGANDPLMPTQQTFFTNALTGPDQLRQRVAFALSQIWVISGNTVPPQGMAPYLRQLLQDAFGNYRTLMTDITLNPGMGNYLNMVNNDKPNPALGTHANENYARELMQLFTLGLDELNTNGTLKLDASGNPIPTYTQDTIQSLAKALTGWTYPTAPGQTLQTHNPRYWIGPMAAVDSNHDTTAKTLLGGTTLPAGQTALQDLNGALDNIFNRTTLPPFVCKRLIQHLVTSNPSASYVQRVVNAFIAGSFGGFGTGSRGDMEAVIAAILLDPEARRGDSNPPTVNPGDGHFREPILFITNLLRVFGATSDGFALVGIAKNMSEPPLQPPSVFNFFPPDFQIPGTALLGPEFNIQTTATTQIRINFVNSFVFGSLGNTTGNMTTVDFTPYATLASDPNALLDSLNALLLHGTMSASARASILAAVNAVPAGSSQNLNRAKTAIYLIASSQYQVEY